MIALEPLGDRAFLARFDSEQDAGAWAAAVRLQRWPGIDDVVLAYQTAAVFAAPGHIDLDTLKKRLCALVPGPSLTTTGTLVELPVLYDGPDLPEVAARLGRAAEEVIALHVESVYTVFAIGFRPGFPYAGYLPPELSGLSRRESPRVRVPAGSVAIAGRQTGVYPCESPGGWHLLGRTPLRIVDLERGQFPIRAGDQLRFVPISPEEFAARMGALL